MQLSAAQNALPLVGEIEQLTALLTALGTMQGDGSTIVGAPVIDSPTLGTYSANIPSMTVAESQQIFTVFQTILNARLATASTALAAL